MTDGSSSKGATTNAAGTMSGGGLKMPAAARTNKQRRRVANESALSGTETINAAIVAYEEATMTEKDVSLTPIERFIAEGSAAPEDEQRGEPPGRDILRISVRVHRDDAERVKCYCAGLLNARNTQ